MPLVGVGAIIIEDDRVVLVKRANPPLQGEWSIVGGVLEVGEMLREAAMREAREETGLLVEPSILLGVYDRVLRDPDGRTLYHYVLIDFLCRRLSGEARAGGAQRPAGRRFEFLPPFLRLGRRRCLWLLHCFFLNTSRD